MRATILFIVLSVSFSSCSVLRSPKSASVNAVRVLHVPNKTQNGVAWDLFGPHADIYVAISSNGSVIYKSEILYESTSNNVYVFKDGTPFLLDDPKAKYRIDLYDYDDFSQNDWIVGFDFTPADFGRTDAIKLSNNTSPVEISLLVEWSYSNK
jgi:hypothetical protein